MTENGYDDRLRVRCSYAEKDAWREAAEARDVSLSTLVRETLDGVVDEERDVIDDEIVDAAERARLDRLVDSDVSDAGLRDKTANFFVSRFGRSNWSADEIYSGMRRRWRMAESLPEELNPEETVEFLDSLVALMYAYEWTGSELREETDGVPGMYGDAVEKLGSEYPENHVGYTRDVLRRLPVEVDGISEIDEKMSNGVMDPLIEETESVESDAETLETSDTVEFLIVPKYEEYVERLRDRLDERDSRTDGARLIADGGIDTRDAYDAETDERQRGLDDMDRDRERGDSEETTTVRARLDDVLDGEVHAMQTTHRYDGAIYLSVVRSCDWSDIDDAGRDIPVLDMRTVVVDLRDDGGVEDVRVTDNGIWIRRDKSVASNSARMFARASSEIDGMESDDALVLDGSDDVDADMLLDAEMSVPDESRETQATHKMESHPGISPERSWGYGGDAPPEAFDLARKMRDAGLEPSDHLIRLWWGQKKPHADERKGIRPDDELRPVAELKGNYGVEVRQRDAGLILVDIDDPEEFDALDVDLPESYSVSSPHGDDERRHVYLTCDEKDRVKDEIGGWSAYQSWGELYVGNPFVVGAGSQLSAYGCDNGEHERGDSDACDACASEDGGYYSVVVDAPIREVDAETLVALVKSEESDDEPEETVEEGVVTCDSCGVAYPEEDAEEYLKDAGKVRVCRGGCE